MAFHDSRHLTRFAPAPAFLLASLGLGVALVVGCGSSPSYSRNPSAGASGGSVVEPPDDGGPGGADGSGGSGVAPSGGTSGSGGSGSGAASGSGGRGTGGASQTGGAPATGGGGTGQGGGGAGSAGTSGSGGRGTGGQGAGGQGTGGRGTGGQATGGAQATGGQATGGQATGGQATGGQATGGQGTGGQGTGGQATGGAPPTRLIVSIDFVGGRPGAPATAMTDAEMAGARPAAHWNSADGPMGTLASLKLSDGSTSAASVTWNAPFAAANTYGIWTIGYTDAPGDVRMMNGHLDPTWTSIPATAPTILTVSGLPAAIAGGTYDVYIYTLGGVSSDMRSYQYGVGAAEVQTVVQDTAPPMPPASPYPYTSANDSQVGTHVIFTRVTGASVSVTAKPVSGTNNRFRAPINGIQIVWPSGS